MPSATWWFLCKKVIKRAKSEKSQNTHTTNRTRKDSHKRDIGMIFINKDAEETAVIISSSKHKLKEKKNR